MWNTGTGIRQKGKHQNVAGQLGEYSRWVWQDMEKTEQEHQNTRNNLQATTIPQAESTKRWITMGEHTKNLDNPGECETETRWVGVNRRNRNTGDKICLNITRKQSDGEELMQMVEFLLYSSHCTLKKRQNHWEHTLVFHHDFDHMHDASAATSDFW